jgi:hypothetical protein
MKKINWVLFFISITLIVASYYTLGWKMFLGVFLFIWANNIKLRHD